MNNSFLKNITSGLKLRWGRSQGRSILGGDISTETWASEESAR